MARRHLNDDEIQQYLDSRQHDGGNPRESADFDADTVRRLAGYEALYQALQHDVPIDLSPEFADAVLGRIESKAADGLSSQLTVTLLGVFGFAAGLSATALSGGFEFFPAFGSSLGAALREIGNLAGSLSTHLDFVPLAGGAFVLTSLSIFDYFFSHNRSKVLSRFR